MPGARAPESETAHGEDDAMDPTNGEERRTPILPMSLLAGALVCALAFLALREPATSGDPFGPETDFLLSSVEGLELGMSREALLALRGEGLVQDASEPGEVPSLLFEEIGSEGGRRRIVYLVPEQTLHQLIYMDTYPPEVLDERIERKLRAAAKEWGRPRSLLAERQRPVGEYFVAVWEIAPDAFLTISYVPRPARDEDGGDAYPVITRYVPGFSDEPPIREIEPQSFDLAAERAAFQERLRSWRGG